MTDHSNLPPYGLPAVGPLEVVMSALHLAEITHAAFGHAPAVGNRGWEMIRANVILSALEDNDFDVVTVADELAKAEREMRVACDDCLGREEVARTCAERYRTALEHIVALGEYDAGGNFNFASGHVVIARTALTVVDRANHHPVGGAERSPSPTTPSSPS